MTNLLKKTIRMIGFSLSLASLGSWAGETCGLKRGDDLGVVKQQLNTQEEPQVFKSAVSSTVKGAKDEYVYHMKERGFYVFLDSDKRVKSFRFNAPYSGSVQGVKLGMTDAEVAALKGSAVRTFDGFVDEDVINQRSIDKKNLMASLPDPSPKSMVESVFAAIEAINEQKFPRMKAVTYNVKNSFLRIDYGAVSQKVAIILTDACTE